MAVLFHGIGVGHWCPYAILITNNVDHGPRRLDLGPRTMVQGSGKVAGKVLTVDL